MEILGPFVIVSRGLPVIHSDTYTLGVKSASGTREGRQDGFYKIKLAGCTGIATGAPYSDVVLVFLEG